MAGDKLRKLSQQRGAATLQEHVTQQQTGFGDNNQLFGIPDDFPRMLVADVDKCHPDPDQPRRVYVEEEETEFAESIQTHGLLEPIMLRPHPTLAGEYMIVFGERRWRAYKRIGKPTIIAIFRTQVDVEEVQLIENTQRSQLGAFETARALKRLIDTKGYAQVMLAKAVGWSQPKVARYLALLTLPAQQIEQYEGDPKVAARISASVLTEVATAGSPDLQTQLWEAALGGATVKDLRSRRTYPTSDNERTAQVDQVKVATALTRAAAKTLKHAEALNSLGVNIQPDQRAALVALRDKIDALLEFGADQAKR